MFIFYTWIRGGKVRHKTRDTPVGISYAAMQLAYHKLFTAIMKRVRILVGWYFAIHFLLHFRLMTHDFSSTHLRLTRRGLLPSLLLHSALNSHFILLSFIPTLLCILSARPAKQHKANEEQIEHGNEWERKSHTFSHDKRYGTKYGMTHNHHFPVRSYTILTTIQMEAPMKDDNVCPPFWINPLFSYILIIIPLPPINLALLALHYITFHWLRGKLQLDSKENWSERIIHTIQIPFYSNSIVKF